uniref:CSON008952 protein n=1 Tax=Culicoides sonorensis TaxID=179676 RepID=A0A336LDC8_CULSO
MFSKNTHLINKMSRNCMLFAVFVTIFIGNSIGILPPSRKALPGEAPFMVRISDGRKYCGGTIIRNNIILTAGHCVDNRDIDRLFVYAGTYNVYDTSRLFRHSVEQMLSHANFRVGDNGVQAFNDIGLIKLSKPLVMSDKIKAISWANVSFNVNSTLFGFGYTDDSYMSPAEFLRSTNVTLIPDAKCNKMLERTITKSIKENYELCAESCACNGDSGSPLIQIVDNEPKIVGITSWLADDLYGCRTPPAVFLKVADFNDWLLEKLKDLELDNVITEKTFNEPEMMNYRRRRFELNT